MTDRRRMPAWLEKLRAHMWGPVILEGDSEYAEARRVFNGMIDRRPLVVCRCRDTRDVQTSLRYAVDYQIPISVRGGGHNVSGAAIRDAGMVIDLSSMTGVIVDPFRQRVTARPGVRLGELDRETQVHGLATPSGIVSDTGLAGLALGGGLGWLMGRFGLTCDNLIAANVVLLDGTLTQASEGDGGDSDLLWALRGAGANFGIVTAFTLAAYPVTTVLAGSIVYPIDVASEALKVFAAAAASFPDELTCSPALMTSRNGNLVLSIDVCCSGKEQQGEDSLAELRAARLHISDNVSVRRYGAWQQYLDDPFRAGRRSYWKSTNFVDLSHELIDLVVERFRTVPSAHTMLTFDHVHGAVRRVPKDATAFGSRHWAYAFLINSNWNERDVDSVNMSWTRELFADVTRAATGCGAYVNYLGSEGAGRSRSAYAGSDFERLRLLKLRYDPTNILNHNQNIAPAESESS